MPPTAQLTDIMVYASPIEKSLDTLARLVNLRTVNAGDGWKLLEDPTSGQRLVVTDQDFGSEWALAISTTDLASTVSALEGENATPVHKGSGFETWRLKEGPVLLLFEGVA